MAKKAVVDWHRKVNKYSNVVVYVVLPLKLQISAAADEPARRHRAVDDQCDKLAVDPLQVL